MSKVRSHDPVWRCEWCGTANAFTGRNSDERCLACRKFRSTPVWTATDNSGQPDGDQLREAYLLGYYSEVANAVASGLVADMDSRFVRDSIRLALAAELGSMETYWGFVDESKSGLAMGWVWPLQPYVTGVTLHLQGDGKRAQTFDRNKSKRKMAVNLEFERALDPDAMTLSVSLFYRGQRKIETEPLKAQFSKAVE